MDVRRFSPACARNRDPILAVLKRVLPERGTVLELASGTGEHGCHFAAHLPALQWQPSDVAPDCLASIEAWRVDSQLDNLRPPLTIDVTAELWPLGAETEGGPSFDGMFNANMIHISPWDSCLGLMRGAGQHLRSGGVLVVYGPFRIDNAHTAPSNSRFDESLRRRDPRWGVRDLEQVVALAGTHGLALSERVAMPANNFMLVFHRR